MHNFSIAQSIISQELAFLNELGFEPPTFFVGTGRLAVDKDVTQYSEVLSVFYTCKPTKRTVQVEYDSGIMKLSPIIKVSIIYQEGLQIIGKLDVSRYMEQHMKRKDAYSVFSGFWSGLPRMPISAEAESNFIRFAMETVAPVLKNELRQTILGKEWPAVNALPR